VRAPNRQLEAVGAQDGVTSVHHQVKRHPCGTHRAVTGAACPRQVSGRPTAAAAAQEAAAAAVAGQEGLVVQEAVLQELVEGGELQGYPLRHHKVGVMGEGGMYTGPGAQEVQAGGVVLQQSA
jgi:hypothetical protein